MWAGVKKNNKIGQILQIQLIACFLHRYLESGEPALNPFIYFIFCLFCFVFIFFCRKCKWQGLSLLQWFLSAEISFSLQKCRTENNLKTILNWRTAIILLKREREMSQFSIYFAIQLKSKTISYKTRGITMQLKDMFWFLLQRSF